jgi:UDP-N-acetylglucosamine acyltransferase
MTGLHVLSVHPSAIVDPGTEMGVGVEVGAGAIIGPGCTLGDGCVIAPRATLERNVRLGARVRIGTGSVIGGDPQDLKYGGEETWVEIGDDTVVREYSTINRGTKQSLRTSVGRNSYLMSYVHMAHDCHVGDNVILANMVQLAGHVTVNNNAIVSALTGVHQFVRIGTYAFVGGYSKIVKDVAPYVLADGNPSSLHGLNTIGLRRNGFPDEVRRELKRAYRLFFGSDLNMAQARERAAVELQQIPEVRTFLRFLDESERGLLM